MQQLEEETSSWSLTHGQSACFWRDHQLLRCTDQIMDCTCSNVNHNHTVSLKHFNQGHAAMAGVYGSHD